MCSKWSFINGAYVTNLNYWSNFQIQVGNLPDIVGVLMGQHIWKKCYVSCASSGLTFRGKPAVFSKLLQYLVVTGDTLLIRGVFKAQLTVLVIFQNVYLNYLMK